MAEILDSNGLVGGAGSLIVGYCLRVATAISVTKTPKKATPINSIAVHEHSNKPTQLMSVGGFDATDVTV